MEQYGQVQGERWGGGWPLSSMDEGCGYDLQRMSSVPSCEQDTLYTEASRYLTTASDSYANARSYFCRLKAGSLITIWFVCWEVYIIALAYITSSSSQLDGEKNCFCIKT